MHGYFEGGCIRNGQTLDGANEIASSSAQCRELGSKKADS
jgi:hypothetical protein